jgi:L-gulonolactone oxidase
LIGDLVHLEKDQSNDTWLAATTSLGLLGVLVRIKMEVVADFKVFANQEILSEDEVLNGDIHAQISPYVTANYWVSPRYLTFHE